MIILQFDGVPLEFNLLMTSLSKQRFPKFPVHGALGHDATVCGKPRIVSVCDIIRPRNNITSENIMLPYYTSISLIGLTASGMFARENVKLRKVF
jgi:hypothetical protein